MGRNNEDFYSNIDDALYANKITNHEANDLQGMPWDNTSRHWSNQKSFIKDVHKNAGLNTSGKEW